MAFSYNIAPDTGSSSTDRLTSGNANHALVLSGTGTKGDAISITYVDPVTHATITLQTVVGNNGTWSTTTSSLGRRSLHLRNF